MYSRKLFKPAVLFAFNYQTDLEKNTRVTYYFMKIKGLNMILRLSWWNFDLSVL